MIVFMLGCVLVGGMLFLALILLVDYIENNGWD